jgi:hypothetical protein
MSENPKFEFVRYVKKTRIELIITVAIIIAVSLLMPKEALVGFASLIATKILTLTIGVSLAHLLRIIAFPYLSLEMMIKDKNYGGVGFVALWYGYVIYAIAVGG